MSIGSTLLNLQGAQQPQQQQGGQMGQPPQQPANLQSPPDMAASNQKLAQGPQGGQYPPSSSGLNIDWSNPNAAAQFAMDMDNRAYQRDMFNRGITNIAASFAPVRDREAMYQQAGLGGPSGSSMLKDIVEIQNQGETLRQRAAQQAAIPAAGKLLLPGSDPDQAKAILSALSSEDFNTAIRQQLHSMEPTDAIKNFDQAKARMKQDGMSDADINRIMPPEMIALGGITDPLYREFVLARSRGDTNAVDYPTYLAQKQAQATTTTEAAKERLGAKEDYHSLEPTFNRMEDEINYLTDPNNRQDVVNAIQKPEFTTEGQAARFLPTLLGGSTQGTLSARAKLDQLQNDLAAEGLHNTKNVRNGREFGALSGATSSLFKPTNSPQDVDRELNALKTRFMTAHANAMAGAGMTVPYEYKGMADRSFFDPSSPLYNHASEEVAPSAASDYLKQHPEFRAQFDQKYGAGASAKVLGQ